MFQATDAIIDQQPEIFGWIGRALTSFRNLQAVVSYYVYGQVNQCKV